MAALHEYEPLGPFAERHGSWDATIHKADNSDGFHRYVTVCLIGDAEAQEDDRVSVEFYAGAERNERYVRHLVQQTKFGLQALDADEASRDKSLSDALKPQLLQSIHCANQLRDRDLTESHLLPAEGESNY